jgi:RNA polymerase sigma-70 factor (ECF subfamily)
MNQANASDEWVMGQVAGGKRECLETLVRRYASPLLTFIERMIGDRHRAEEVFQDVFLAVWRKRRTYKFPRPFRSWLFAIAANRCRQVSRRARSPDVLPLDDKAASVPVASGPTPADVAVATEAASLVGVAVAQLPPQQRTVLILRNWNGLSYAEISQIVGRSEATVRSHMHHALAGIRRYLEPRMSSDDIDA